MKDLLFEEAARLEKLQRSFALASIVRSHGSTPRKSGRMLIRGDGTTLGTIGGGPLEFDVVEQAKEALALGRSRMVKSRLVETGTEAVGMSCGGSMEVFVDVVKPHTKLLIFGAGHVGLAVAEAASLLEYDITVIDHRHELANPGRFPMAGSFICDEDLDTAVGKLEIFPDTRILIVTADQDFEVLDRVINSRARYIGMLGSDRKVALALKRLRESGVPEERIAALHSPVGIPIAAETPEEIAVSILAELIRFQSGKA